MSSQAKFPKTPAGIGHFPSAGHEKQYAALRNLRPCPNMEETLAKIKKRSTKYSHGGQVDATRYGLVRTAPHDATLPPSPPRPPEFSRGELKTFNTFLNTSKPKTQKKIQSGIDGNGLPRAWRSKVSSKKKHPQRLRNSKARPLLPYTAPDRDTSPQSKAWTLPPKKDGQSSVSYRNETPLDALLDELERAGCGKAVHSLKARSQRLRCKSRTEATLEIDQSRLPEMHLFGMATGGGGEIKQKIDAEGRTPFFSTSGGWKWVPCHVSEWSPHSSRYSVHITEDEGALFKQVHAMVNNHSEKHNLSTTEP